MKKVSAIATATLMDTILDMSNASNIGADDGRKTEHGMVMEMREKLIELLEAVPHPQRLYPDLYVDHLIANGVTIPVRCKDCEKWQRHTHVDRERGHCWRFNMTKHESGFCDRGERRTDD